MPKRRLAMAATTVMCAVLIPTTAGAAPPRAHLLADTDRDGLVTGADHRGRGEWTRDRGAIALPNLDDDQGRCRPAGPAGRLTDAELAVCDDGADEVVNGVTDAEDLAPLRVAPVRGAGSPTSGRISVDAASRDHVRVFLPTSDGHVALSPDHRFTAARLRRGIDLAVEVRDIPRDAAVWDGFVDVTLTVERGHRVDTDTVRLRVAPLLLTHDLMPVERVLVSDNNTTPQDVETGDYDPDAPVVPRYAGEERFLTELAGGLAAAGVDARPLGYPTGGDRWMRDHFITGYTAAPGSEQTVLVRAPGMPPGESTPDFPLRDSGRPLFSAWRGPGVAAVQQFDPARVGDDERNGLWGSFGSTGNFLVAPPHGAWPAGRILYGSDGGEAAPDETFVRMLEAQRDQGPMPVDTSWLGVGHIDEFLSFLPADNERGWTAMVADPRLGEELLRRVAADGGGDGPLITGVDPAATPHPGITVNEALAAPGLTAGNRIATAGIDRALAALTTELGLDPAEIVRVPALFERLEVDGYPRQDIVANYLPAIVNGVETGTGTFLAARPHGPSGTDGRDVFQEAAERAIGEVGGRIAWVEDWEYAHAVGTVGGELHCVTNVLRDRTATPPWWLGAG
ncbi:protein-arginine deiminase family protein [Phytomonospora sp. NPDC050363]|uniref:protein-arginine deiminase family protein n=1 Tax=Phytomonospora sp. NPDC050363 TaxID=3155642 RepID=UPI0033CDF767